MARPNRYDSLEKPKGGAEVKVKDEQDIVFLAFFTAGGASLKINDTLPAAKIRANEALQDLTSVCPILQCRTTWQCGISTVVVLSSVFVTQTSKLFLEACISPACKNFLEIGKKTADLCPIGGHFGNSCVRHPP